jgi:hypothetical protein
VEDEPPDELAEALPPEEQQIPAPIEQVAQPIAPEVTTRSGRTIRAPCRLIATVALFLTTFSPLPTDGTVLHLLQPDVEAHAEPHPFALFTEHIRPVTQALHSHGLVHEAQAQPRWRDHQVEGALVRRRPQISPVH